MPQSPLELHFGRYRDLAAPVARRIEQERARRIDAGGLAGLLREPVEVLVPSRAAAEAIARELLALAGRPVAGVEIRTLERLATALLNRAGRFPRVAGDGEQKLAMAGAAAGARAPLQAVDGLAPLLLRTWRDVRDSDRTAADFARETGRAIDRARGAAITAAWKRFEATLARIGAIDPADLLLEAARGLDDGSLAAPKQIVFGFYDATAVQERLLFALHRAGALDSVWIPIPREGDAIAEEYRYAQRFIESLERLGRAGAGAPSITRYGGGADVPFDIARASLQIDEVRAAVARAGALIDAGVPPREIAIVARSVDDRLASRIRRAARELGVPALVRGGRPFLSHPFARAVRDLLRIRRERFHREIVVELASVPFRRGVLPENVRASDLDAIARRAEIAAATSAMVRRILPAADERLRERLTLYADTVAALEALSAGVDTPKRGGAWASWLLQVGESLRIDTETDLAALERLVDLAALLRRVDPAGTPIPPERIASLLESVPDLDDDAAEGERIWTGDLMALRGRSFRHVFAVAMQQEIFPQRRGEDLLLPNRERKRAGIREIEDGRLEERLLFRLLRDAATEALHFSYSAGDGGRQSFRPSMFLKDLALAGERDPAARKEIVDRFDAWVDRHAREDAVRRPLAAIDAEAIRGAGELPGLLHRQIALAARAGSRSPHDGFIEMDEAVRAVVEARLAALSPGKLQTFGECPHRFFLQAVLRIDEVDEPDVELEITARKKGTLEHQILERFYRDLPEEAIAGAGDERALDPELRARLAEKVDDAFEEYEQRYPAPSPLLRRVEKRIAMRTLEEFVAGDLAELAATGYRPWKFELVFGIGEDGNPPEIEPVPLPVDGPPMRLRGRIDRVDRGPDGRLRIVDYKRGRGNYYRNLAEKIEKGHALQLPLYALAAAELFGVAADRIEAAIRPIASREKADRFSFALRDLGAGVGATLATFARAIVAGRFPALAGDAKADHCRWCAVAYWCRTRHTPEEAAESRRWESARELLEEIEGGAR